MLRLLRQQKILSTTYLPTDDIVELSIQSIDGSFEEILLKGNKQQGENLIQIETEALQGNVYILLLKTQKRSYFERVALK